MGQERECTLHIGNLSASGRALLETDHLLFRGPERIKVRFRDLTRVEARGGILRLEFEGGPAELDLGTAAEIWARKILHPPTRIEKLGVKPGVSVKLAGDFEDGFQQELRRAGAVVVDGRTRPDILLFAAAGPADLRKLPRASAFEPDGALWVVYPKGVTAIREIEVIEAGRAAGLKDVKVAAFSATRTALKFVVPLARR